MKHLAVVGAGIGGCSAAYFANQNIPNAKLTIYDAQKRVGGRILTQNAAGTNLELGASFINSTNKTILNIIKSTQLKLTPANESKDFAIWNGSEIIFRSNKTTLFTNLKLVSRYRLSIIRALSLLREAKIEVAKLYRVQTENPSEVAELFESAGLSKWHKETFDKILTEKGVSISFIDEIAEPITRTIYSQDADLGGFAGISSVIGVYGGPIYRLVEGNSTLPAHLAQVSGADVKLNQRVVSIEKTREDQFRISTGNEASLFDGVFVAAPLDLAGIAFDGVAKPAWEPLEYQKVYTRIAKGILDPGYFGLQESAKLPAIVLTTKQADPVTHIAIQELGKGESLVAVTSNKPLNESAFNGIFKGGGSPVLEHCWEAAYPKFKPVAKLPPTRLNERLFYLNSVEAAVSSMETTAFSALNAVKMMAAALR